MVRYEWDIETVTDVETERYEKDEVLDHDFCPSYRVLADFLKACQTPGPGLRYEPVLVRDDDNGRSWAYMENGKLPEFFEDAYQHQIARVPQRFHAEVARAAK